MNTNSCKNLNSLNNNDKSLTKKPIIIIGAGWSGLACAVTLIQAGYKVCLLESARQIGGRARTINIKKAFSSNTPQPLIDNGQHIMLGAYHYTLKLFKSLGIKEAEQFQRCPLELQMLSPDNNNIHLKAAPLPAPLHLLSALLTLKGMSLKERFKAVNMAVKLSLCGFQLKKDISVKQLLQQHKQTEKLIKALWEPLCLASMNTPIDYASAQIFLKVLQDSFSNDKQDSDLLFFKQDLSQTFCAPAEQFITKNDSSIHCAEKVISLQYNQYDQYRGFHIQTSKANYSADQVILATPPYIADKLLHQLSGQNCLQPDNASLIFCYEPIYTIYMQYSARLKLPHIMTGLFAAQSSTTADITGQWIIDRSFMNQAGLIAVVISGSGKHTQCSASQLVAVIHNELKLIIEDLPTLVEHKIIKQKRATFSCRVDIQKQRPKNTTSIPGLYLAGDYTDTGYPATLEGAVKSGVMAAEKIIALP